MNKEFDRICRLAEVLTMLVEFVPKTNDELEKWYDEAQCILDDHELLRRAPHFLWHYLADADIRMKDEVYAEMHHARISLMLQSLKQGVMPSDEDTFV